MDPMAYVLSLILILPEGIGDDPKQAVKPEKIKEIIEAAKLLWSQRYQP